MGTSYNVQIVGVLPPQFAERIDLGIKHKLNYIEGLMSTWRDESELSQINRHPVHSWKSISPETFQVIRLALTISEQTSGSFDVTVGPLVNIWGFGPQFRQPSVPDERQIKRALQRVGYRHIKLDQETHGIKRDKDVYIDLSAIAKGYAVDQVAEYLQHENLHNYLIEVGGEIRVKGTKPAGDDWVIAIESPQLGVRNAYVKLTLKDHAIATSGDYRNFYEIDGRRYSHTIDPETGRPVTHELVSVTVIDKSTARADALATALLVMGPEEGMKITEQRMIPAFFIVNRDGHFKTLFSTKFRAYSSGQDAANS